MSRLGRWVVTVAVTVAAGGLLGHRFGWTLRVVSHDYIVVPGDYLELGLRLGLVVGTILGAALVVGPRPPPSWRRLAGGLLLAGAVALVTVVAAGLLSPSLWEHGVIDGSGWSLPNPRRHAAFLGLDLGARAGPLVGALAGAVFLWRGRPEPDGPPDPDGG